jgi:hypothetical protein
MRALRNSLSGAVLGLAVAVGACSAQYVPKSPAPSAAKSADYYPLAAGNRWRYSCSVEGQDSLIKELEIVGPAKVAGHEGFKAVSRVNGSPADVYLYEDAQGRVHRAYSETGDLDEIIAFRHPSVGSQFKDRKITRTSLQKIPVLGTVSTLVLENFSFDDPALSPERRSAWRGEYFAKDVGMVADADGTGAECTLQDYRLHRAAK